MKNPGYSELQKLSPEKIVKLQNKKFKATVKYILPHVEFYSELFEITGVKPARIKTVEDWQKYGLPIVKKKYFRKNPRAFVVRGDERELANAYLKYLASFNKKELIRISFHHDLKGHIKDFFTPKMLIFSGGTTGNPVPEFLTTMQKKEGLDVCLEVCKRMIENKLGKKTIGMNLFPYAPHLGWHAVHMAFDKILDTNMNTAAGGAIRTKDLVEMARLFRTNVFAGMNDYFLKFLRKASQKKMKLDKDAMFINGSIKMSDTNREKIRKLMKKLGAKPKILDVYAATELKESLFIECKEKSGFHHITPMMNIVRVMRELEGDENFCYDWEFVDGKKGGKAVLWNLDGAGTQLHGYQIGDEYDKIVHNKCRHCKLNVQRIYGVRRI